jgi:mono/diheme cytochrome c family protein
MPCSRFHFRRACFILAVFPIIVFIAVAPGLESAFVRATPQPVAQSAEQAGRDLYVKHVRPLLEQHCNMCHSSDPREGGLDLSSGEGLMRGGKSGPVIVPGNANASLFYKLVAHQQEPAMPYKAGKLPREAIALLELWINLGAPFPPAGSGASTQSESALQKTPGNSKFFVERVRPVLEASCFTCHGGKFKQAGLSLATRDTLLRGSDNGPVVIPGKADESLLVKKIRHQHEPGMPYKAEKLPDEAIASIVEWVNTGVAYDRPLEMPVLSTQAETRRQTGDHWAFKPPVRPSIPNVKNKGWVRNPIDAFIAARHGEKGLTPLPAAEKRVLLRRVYLDLIGLPPAQQEIQAFLSDSSPDAYEKVVDRLLASPRYGERWGRHWMDIWRYSDWYGFGNQIRNSQFHIWHWRDWIIESLNQDKGYDRMIVEMLAGDEIAPTDLNTIRATGYLARSWYRFNRNAWLQETVEHAAAGFLGITLKCARCHDHKYDPIAQEEYYKFRAFFEPYDVRLDRAPGEPDLTKDGIPRAYDADPREATTKEPFLPGIYAETYRFIRGDERNPDKEHPLSPAVPEALRGHWPGIQQVKLPLYASYPSLNLYVQDDMRKQARQEIEKAESTLAKAIAALTEARQRVAAMTTQLANSPVSAAAPIREGPGQPAQVDFTKEVKPIFERSCLSCHKSGNAKSGLVLETPESIQEGGKVNGPALIPRKSGESPLILYLQGKKKPRMPFGSAPLPEAEIALIQNWIDQLPEEEPRVALRKAEGALAVAEKQLAWARANLPAVEARIEADKAKFADPPNPQAESLGKAARQLERQSQLFRAEENVLKAQQKLSEALSLPEPGDEKERDKRITAARRGLEAAQAALTQPQKDYTPLGEQYPKTSSGRRLALAQWMTHRSNPLTARVAINHIWLRHFGKPLVPTVVNFGQNGKPPSHPELLDWLACEFMEKNWSMKAIHRLMVTSNTYRMRSSSTEPAHPNRSIDSENEFLWRMNSRRMEAEIVRDSLLSVAGQLDTTVGGPDLEESQAEHNYRRSIYFRHTPDSQAMFLKLFDAPDPTDCYKRDESIVPQQALALANSKLSYTQARLLARKISGESQQKAGDSQFIRDAFEITLGRPPTEKELAESTSFLRQQKTLFVSPKGLTLLPAGTASAVPPSQEPSLRARENLVHVLFNHNDFVTIR